MRTFLRGLGLALAMLCSLSARADYFGALPAEDWMSFYVKVDTPVAICVVGTSNCGASKVVKAATETTMTHCGGSFDNPPNIPAGGKLECRAVAAVATPPVVTLPAGVAQIAVYGALFAHPTDMYVQGCAVDFTACTKVYLAAADTGGSNFCTVANFPGMPTSDACFSVPKPAVTSAYFQSCYPDPDIQYTVTMVGFTVVPTSFTSKNYWKVDVPTSVGSANTGFGMWKDTCTGKVVGQFYTLGSLAKLLVAYTLQQLGSSDAINAWVKTQPIENRTPAEDAFAVATLAPYNAPVVTPPVVTPPASKYVVAKNGAVLTRPVYQRTSDTVRGTTEIGRVAVGDPCDETVKSGTGGFYGVAGRANVSKPGTVFAAGAVAGCSLATQ